VEEKRMAGSPSGSQVEYIGFASKGGVREYALRVRRGDQFHDFTLAIPNEAFLAQRVRYQDGPEVCFLKLQRELLSCADGLLPSPYLSVSDAELEEYRSAHAPKTPQRRPKTPVEGSPSR
jgi:hypothetical protein